MTFQLDFKGVLVFLVVMETAHALARDCPMRM